MTEQPWTLALDSFPIAISANQTSSRTGQIALRRQEIDKQISEACLYSLGASSHGEPGDQPPTLRAIISGREGRERYLKSDDEC